MGRGAVVVNVNVPRSSPKHRQGLHRRCDLVPIAIGHVVVRCEKPSIEIGWVIAGSGLLSVIVQVWLTGSKPGTGTFTPAPSRLGC